MKKRYLKLLGTVMRKEGLENLALTELSEDERSKSNI